MITRKLTLGVSGLAFGPDGTIYVVHKYEDLSAIFQRENSERIFFPYDESSGSYTPNIHLGPPVIGMDETIYLAVDNSIYVIQPDGNILWTKDIGTIGIPAIGDDGTIYAWTSYYDSVTLTGHYGLSALNPDGTEKWATYEMKGIPVGMAIGQDATIYCVLEENYNNGYLFAVRGNSKGYAKSSWPGFQHDAKRTGRADFKPPPKIIHNAPDYLPGENLTIMNTIIYAEAFKSMKLNISLPEGWSYHSSGLLYSPDIEPPSGATNNLAFVWNIPPKASALYIPVTFEYKLSVSEISQGDQSIIAKMEFHSDSETKIISAQPNPLVISEFIIPKSNISVIPDSLSFGEVRVGTSSPNLSITLSNNGSENLEVESIWLINTLSFSLDFEPCTTLFGSAPFAIGPQESCTINILFKPISIGDELGTLYIRSNDYDSSLVQIPITGTGTDIAQPNISVIPQEIDFGDLKAGLTVTSQQILTIQNIGQGDLHISKISLSDNTAFNLQLEGGDATCGIPPLIIGQGDSCLMTISFNPLSVGIFNANITITTNDHNSAILHIPLVGTGGSDEDGVPDSEEHGPDGTHQGYDGNGDFIPDCEQNNVVSLHTYDGKYYITLTCHETSSIFSPHTSIIPSPADKPSDINFLYGFYTIDIREFILGTKQLITLVLPEGEEPNTFYNYGPTLENPSPHWYEFNYDGQTGAKINKNVIVLHFIDGQRGDSDLLSNGRIENIGAPGFLSSDTPKGTTVSTNGGSGGGGCFLEVFSKPISH